MVTRTGNRRGQTAQAVTPKTAEVETNVAKLASRLNDETIVADFNRSLDADEEVTQSPLLWAMDFRAVYSAEEIKAMPIVGTRAVDENGKPTGINNPDIIKVDRVMPIGGTRKVDYSWYEGLADNCSVGQALTADIERLNKRASEELGNKDQANTRLATAKKRQDRFYNRISKAFAYLQQCVNWESIPTDATTGKQKVCYHLVMEDLERAGVVVKADDGTTVQVPSKSPKPIKVWDGTPNGTGQVFLSVGSFIGLDVQASIEKDGGSWNSLMSPESDGANETLKQVAAAKWSQLDTICASVANLLSIQGSDKTAAMEFGKKETGDILAYHLVRATHALNLLVPQAMPGYERVKAQVEADAAKEQRRRELAQTVQKHGDPDNPARNITLRVQG